MMDYCVIENNKFFEDDIKSKKTMKFKVLAGLFLALFFIGAITCLIWAIQINSDKYTSTPDNLTVLQENSTSTISPETLSSDIIYPLPSSSSSSVLYIDMDKDNSCATPKGVLGVCVFFNECPLIYNTIVKFKGKLPIDDTLYIRSSVCAYEDRQTKICCPIETPQETTTIKEPIPAKPPSSLTYRKMKTNLLPEQICGKMINNKLSRSNKTEPMEYPWMAIIQYQTSEGIEQKCGGSIINNRYILTAAHCITNLENNIKVVSVVLGEHNTKTDDDFTSDGQLAPKPRTVLVEEIIPHPAFNKNTSFNDIGLLRLSEDIDFTPENIGPICLPVTEITANTEYSKVIVTGFGMTEKNVNSDVLLQAYLDIVPFDECKKKFSRRINVTKEVQMCARGEDGVSFCQGDSGSPAIAPAETHYGVKYVQFGIVSGRTGYCGLIHPTPGLYTRVTSYMEWIINTLRD